MRPRAAIFAYPGLNLRPDEGLLRIFDTGALYRCAAAASKYSGQSFNEPCTLSASHLAIDIWRTLQCGLICDRASSLGPIRNHISRIERAGMFLA